MKLKLVAEFSKEMVGLEGGMLELLNTIPETKTEKYIDFFNELAPKTPDDRRTRVSTLECLKTLSQKQADQAILKAMSQVPALLDDIAALLEQNVIKQIYSIVDASKQEYNKSAPLGKLRNHLKLMALDPKTDPFKSFMNDEGYLEAKKRAENVDIKIGGGLAFYTSYYAFIEMLEFLEKGPGQYAEKSFKTILMKNMVDSLGLNVELDMKHSKNSLDQFKTQFTLFLTKVGMVNQGINAVEINQIILSTILIEEMSKTIYSEEVRFIPLEELEEELEKDLKAHLKLEEDKFNQINALTKSIVSTEAVNIAEEDYKQSNDTGTPAPKLSSFKPEHKFAKKFFSASTGSTFRVYVPASAHMTPSIKQFSADQFHSLITKDGILIGMILDGCGFEATIHRNAPQQKAIAEYCYTLANELKHVENLNPEQIGENIKNWYESKSKELFVSFKSGAIATCVFSAAILIPHKDKETYHCIAFGIGDTLLAQVNEKSIETLITARNRINQNGPDCPHAFPHSEYGSDTLENNLNTLSISITEVSAGSELHFFSDGVYDSSNLQEFLETKKVTMNETEYSEVQFKSTAANQFYQVTPKEITKQCELAAATDMQEVKTKLPDKKVFIGDDCTAGVIRIPTHAQLNTLHQIKYPDVYNLDEQIKRLDHYVNKTVSLNPMNTPYAPKKKVFENLKTGFENAEENDSIVDVIGNWKTVEVDGKNSYDIAIANRRKKSLFSSEVIKSDEPSKSQKFIDELEDNFGELPAKYMCNQ